MLAAERLLLDRAAQLARFREVLAAAPGEIADMVERLTAVIPDVQTMGPAVEVGPRRIGVESPRGRGIPLTLPPRVIINTSKQMSEVHEAGEEANTSRLGS